MPAYRCITCGKTFDAAKDEICPRCGTFVAPAVLTQIERQKTAARLRADALENDDPHCHEDDSWSGSQAARIHRARTAAWHETTAQGSNPYTAAATQPLPTRGTSGRPAAAPSQPAPAVRQSQQQTEKKPKLWLIPVIIMILYYILIRIMRFL